MRPIFLICAALPLVSAGCASAIARCGRDLPDHASREEVHRCFGEPREAPKVQDPACEDFRCHAKVAENFRSVFLLLPTVYTLGLADLYFVPEELGRAAWQMTWGYDVHVEYDSNGHATKYTIDGVPGMPWPLKDVPAGHPPTVATGSAPTPVVQVSAGSGSEGSGQSR